MTHRFVKRMKNQGIPFSVQLKVLVIRERRHKKTQEERRSLAVLDWTEVRPQTEKKEELVFERLATDDSTATFQMNKKLYICGGYGNGYIADLF